MVVKGGAHQDPASYNLHKGKAPESFVIVDHTIDTPLIGSKRLKFDRVWSITTKNRIERQSRK